MAAALCAPAVYAQESAELKIEAAPQEPGGGSSDDSFVDKLKNFADDIQLVDRLNGDVDGWYPRLGGMTTGSGFALGPGYRTHLFDDRIFVDGSAAVTQKGYKAVDGKVEWLQSRYERVELWTNFRYQDFPQEDFFGLGGNLSRESRTNYALTSTDIMAMGVFHARRWLRIGADLGYFNPTLGPGTDRNYPTTGALFSDVEAPGLGAQPSFLHTTTFAEIDYRDQPENARSGGYYKGAFGWWDDRTLHGFDFGRFDGEVAQFVPIVTKSHVFAARMGVSYVNNEPDDRVPFYVLPYVGGSRSLRSVEEFRYTDENALFLNAEYRWAVIKHLNIALFYDAGKVSRNWNDIDLGDLKTGYGIGFRGGTSKRVFVRLDIGMGGGEGRQIFFKLGPSF